MDFGAGFVKALGADEVARAVLWLLASPGASYVTGATLAVSGGR